MKNGKMSKYLEMSSTTYNLDYYSYLTSLSILFYLKSRGKKLDI